MIENQNHEKKRPEVTIRQMEIDDLSPVYHLGEQLFTSDRYTILYRTWDPYEVTDAFTSDPDYFWLQKLRRITGLSDSYSPLPSRRKAPPGRNTDMLAGSALQKTLNGIISVTVFTGGWRSV